MTWNGTGRPWEGRPAGDKATTKTLGRSHGTDRHPREVGTSPTMAYLDGRDRVLSRGHQWWLAGRLLRSTGTVADAIEVVAEVADLEGVPQESRRIDLPWRPLSFLELVDLGALDLPVGTEVAA